MDCLYSIVVIAIITAQLLLLLPRPKFYQRVPNTLVITTLDSLD